MTPVWILIGLLAPAMAGELQLGAGLAVAADVGNPLEGAHGRFGPGFGLHVPLRYELDPAVRLRATLRADLATGRDRVTWSQVVNGEPVRFYSDDHWAMLASVGVLAGVELAPPLQGPVQPFLGVGAGPAWFGTYHSFRDETAILLDPDQNDLESRGNVDPFTSQAAVITDLYLGGSTPMGDRLALWLESGYSMAFLQARALRKTPPELDARREPYGWNALRVAVGVSMGL